MYYVLNIYFFMSMATIFYIRKKFWPQRKSQYLKCDIFGKQTKNKTKHLQTPKNPNPKQNPQVLFRKQMDHLHTKIIIPACLLQIYKKCPKSS